MFRNRRRGDLSTPSLRLLVSGRIPKDYILIVYIIGRLNTYTIIYRYLILFNDIYILLYIVPSRIPSAED